MPPPAALPQRGVLGRLRYPTLQGTACLLRSSSHNLRHRHLAFRLIGPLAVWHLATVQRATSKELAMVGQRESFDKLRNPTPYYKSEETEGAIVSIMLLVLVELPLSFFR